MKRLVKASEITDKLIIDFKSLVTMHDMAEMIKNIYDAWTNANGSNVIKEDYSSFEDWFNDYYTSIVDDCVSKANKDIVFNEKYKALSVEETENLEREIEDYIQNSASKIHKELTI